MIDWHNLQEIMNVAVLAREHFLFKRQLHI